MADTKGGPDVPAISTGSLKQKPVFIEVINGVITCTPDTVELGKNNDVEWIYNPGGVVVEFETTRPFGKKRHEAVGGSVRSGPNDCKEHERFKYKVTVPDPKVRPLDPIVDVDPARP